MYEVGCFVAFCLWCSSLVWMSVSLNSQLERNLNRIGFRLSWVTLSPRPMGNNHYKRGVIGKTGKFLFIALSGFVSIFLSWLHVAFFVGTFAYSRVKDSGAPQNIKEFRWRMRNVDLSFDEIVKGMALTSGDQTPFEELKQRLYEEMVDRGNA